MSPKKKSSPSRPRASHVEARHGTPVSSQEQIPPSAPSLETTAAPVASPAAPGDELLALLAVLRVDDPTGYALAEALVRRVAGRDREDTAPLRAWNALGATLAAHGPHRIALAMHIIETDVDAGPGVLAEEEDRQVAPTRTRHELVTALEALGWKLIDGPRQNFDVWKATVQRGAASMLVINSTELGVLRDLLKLAEECAEGGQ
jgi:hypothetical protein